MEENETSVVIDRESRNGIELYIYDCMGMSVKVWNMNLDDLAKHSHSL